MFESLQDAVKRTGFPYRAILEWYHKGYIKGARATDRPNSRIMVMIQSVDEYIAMKVNGEQQISNPSTANGRRIPE